MRKDWYLALALVLVAASPAQGADLFSKPDQLCDALAPVGLPTNGWKPSRAVQGEFVCLSQLVEFGAAGPVGMPSNIAFYVNGTRSDRANEIIVKININNPDTRGMAFQKLQAAITRLFRIRELVLPEELQSALRSQRPVSTSASFGTAELIHEPGRIESYKAVFVDAAFVQQKEAAKSNAQGEFARCIEAVAQAAGYSASLLNGDGEPVQESGYQSFFIKGRGEDRFFCEVHPGGKYRIRAALGGRFPFKLLREGTF